MGAGLNANEAACLDATRRAEIWTDIQKETFDLLVIGGGITGAGIALDAASRGMSVLLVEMQDFAAGTSSRSTRLIHGGLRYLKQMEFRLVKETGRERAVIRRLAPHIVKPEKMLLPLYKGGSLGRMGASFGLWMYDRMAGVKGKERRKMLSAAETRRLEPLLRDEGLRGGGLYFEYQTNDARLTISVIRTAASHGAVCLNYAAVRRLLYDPKGKVCGAEVSDELKGDRIEVRAQHIVNAAGPWVDDLRRLEGPIRGISLTHTKGVHLVFSHARLPLRHALYADLPDGRMMFVIPHGEQVYAGTTDTLYDGPLDGPPILREDVEYVINGLNGLFPELNLGPEDVESGWAGIRPLIAKEGAGPSELSRRDEIVRSHSGLISIAGGKLTGYRKMAQRVVDDLAADLRKSGKNVGPCRTDLLPLAGAGEVPETKGLAAELAAVYGADMHEILAAAEGGSEAALLGAALEFSMRREACLRVSDFLIRRIPWLYFHRKEAAGHLDTLSARIAGRLLLSDSEELTMKDEFLRDWDAANVQALFR